MNVMSKAEQIFDKHGFDFTAFEYENEYSAKAIINAVKEIVDKSFEAGRDFQYAVGKPPSKAEFSKQLFDTPSLSIEG